EVMDSTSSSEKCFRISALAVGPMEMRTIATFCNPEIASTAADMTDLSYKCVYLSSERWYFSRTEISRLDKDCVKKISAGLPAHTRPQGKSECNPTPKASRQVSCGDCRCGRAKSECNE